MNQDNSNLTPEFDEKHVCLDKDCLDHHGHVATVDPHVYGSCETCLQECNPPSYYPMLVDRNLLYAEWRIYNAFHGETWSTRISEYEEIYFDYFEPISPKHGAWKNCPTKHGEEMRPLLYCPSDLAWGDYTGSTVSRANYKEFLKQWGDHECVAGRKCVVKLAGHGIAVYGDCRNVQVGECLEKLADYPIITEGSVFEVENELISEALDDWFLPDLRGAIGAVYEELDPSGLCQNCWREIQEDVSDPNDIHVICGCGTDEAVPFMRTTVYFNSRVAVSEIPDEKLLEIAHDVIREENMEWSFESATSATIEVDEIAAHIDVYLLKEYLEKHQEQPEQNDPDPVDYQKSED